MIDIDVFRRRAAEAVEYSRRHGYNDRVVLLWDLSLHSGRRRFVVWDVERDCMLHAFVASHGSGSKRRRVPSIYAKVSNEDGSHRSSEGFALVAERYEGRYGVAYRLDGLQESNSEMRKRCIVLHGWSYTPSFPIWPLPVVGSWGCPVLSRRAMRLIDDILQRNQRVILWTYSEKKRGC